MAAPTEAHATGDSCQNDPNICEIEATVITGFESVAKEDIEEKLGAEVKAGRGKVTLWLCMEKLPEVNLIANFVVCKFSVKTCDFTVLT